MGVKVGGMFFERGDGGSPEGFERICEVFSIGEIGENSDVVDATTFCSGGYREQILGLSDGSELPIELNYDADTASFATLVADTKAKLRKNYRLAIEHGSPTQYLEFAAVPTKWGLVPSLEDKNTAMFTYKISGEITLS